MSDSSAFQDGIRLSADRKAGAVSNFFIRHLFHPAFIGTVVLLFACSLFFFSFAFSQAPPQGINYQAVARDAAGNPLATQSITATFRVRQTIPTGTVVYRGTQNTTTNQFGLFTAIIGQTGSDSGSFATINWGADVYFLQVIVNGNDMGTTQFMSVPYALYSQATGDTSLWKKNGSDIYRLSGNVGIGTTVPGAKLEVFKNSGAGVPDASPTSDAPVIRMDRQTAATATYIGQYLGSIQFAGKNYSWVKYDAASINAIVTNVAYGSDSLSADLLFHTKTFANSLSEKMRITSNGRVGIGTTAPVGQFELSLDEGRKPATNTWTIVSDERLKTIEGLYSKGLKEVLQLNPILYRYKNTAARKFNEQVLLKTNVGFSAQEVQKIFPECVDTEEDGMLNFNFHAILVAYTNAFKEQQKIIDRQQKKIDNLNSAVGNLQTENQMLKAELTAQQKEIQKIKQQLGIQK